MAVLVALAISDAVLLYRTASARLVSAHATVGNTSVGLRMDADVYYARLPGSSAYEVESIRCTLSEAPSQGARGEAVPLASAVGRISRAAPDTLVPSAKARYTAELLASTPNAKALVDAATSASHDSPVLAECAVTHALRLLGPYGAPVRMATHHSYALSRDAMYESMVDSALGSDMSLRSLDIRDVSLDTPTITTGRLSGGGSLTVADSGFLTSADARAELPPPPPRSVDAMHLEVVSLEFGRLAYAVEAETSSGASVPQLELASERAALELRATPDGGRTAASAHATASAGCADKAKTLASLCELSADVNPVATMATAVATAAARWGLPIAPEGGATPGTAADTGRSLLLATWPDELHTSEMFDNEDDDWRSPTPADTSDDEGAWGFEREYTYEREDDYEGPIDVSFAGYASDALCSEPPAEDPHHGKLTGKRTAAQLSEREFELVAQLVEGSLMGALLGELHDLTAGYFGAQEQKKSSIGAFVKDNTAEGDETLMRLDSVSSIAEDGKRAYLAVATVAGYQANMRALVDPEDYSMVASLTVDEEEPEWGDNELLFEARVFNEIADRHMDANLTVHIEGQKEFEVVAEGFSPDDSAAAVNMTVRVNLDEDYDDVLDPAFEMEVQLWQGGGHAYGPHEAGSNIFIVLPDSRWQERFHFGYNNTIVASEASAMWSVHIENYDYDCGKPWWDEGPCATPEETDVRWGGVASRTDDAMAAMMDLWVNDEETLYSRLEGSSSSLESNKEAGSLVLDARLDGTPLFVGLGSVTRGAMGDGEMQADILVSYDGEEKLRANNVMDSARLAEPQGAFQRDDDSMDMRMAVYLDGSQRPSMEMRMGVLMGSEMLTCVDCGMMDSSMAMQLDDEPLFTYTFEMGRYAMDSDNGVTVHGLFGLFTDQLEVDGVPTLQVSGNASSGDSHIAGAFESEWEGDRVLYAAGQAESDPADRAGEEKADASARIWIKDAFDAAMAGTGYAGPTTHGGSLTATFHDDADAFKDGEVHDLLAAPLRRNSKSAKRKSSGHMLALRADGLHNQPHRTDPSLLAASSTLSISFGEDEPSYEDLPLVASIHADGALGDDHGTMAMVVKDEDKNVVYRQSGEAWTWTDHTGERIDITSDIIVDEGAPTRVTFGGLRRDDAMGNNLTVVGEDMLFDWQLMATTWDPDGLGMDLWVHSESGNKADGSFSSMALASGATVTRGMDGIFCLLPGVDGQNSLSVEVDNLHQDGYWDSDAMEVVYMMVADYMSLDVHMSGDNDDKSMLVKLHQVPEGVEGAQLNEGDSPMLFGANVSWGQGDGQIVPRYIQATIDSLSPAPELTHHNEPLFEGQYVGPYFHLEGGYDFVDLGISMDRLIPEARMTVSTSGSPRVSLSTYGNYDTRWASGKDIAKGASRVHSANSERLARVEHEPTTVTVFIRYDAYDIPGGCEANDCYILRTGLSIDAEVCELGARDGLSLPLRHGDFACEAASRYNDAPPPVHIDGLVLPTQPSCPGRDAPPLVPPTLPPPSPRLTPTPAPKKKSKKSKKSKKAKKAKKAKEAKKAKKAKDAEKSKKSKKKDRKKASKKLLEAVKVVCKRAKGKKQCKKGTAKKLCSFSKKKGCVPK